MTSAADRANTIDHMRIARCDERRASSHRKYLLARAYRDDSSVSRLLEEMLEQATATELIVALVNGLGVAGNEKSVEPLRRASSRATDPQIKAECADAIQAIQLRP